MQTRAAILCSARLPPHKDQEKREKRKRIFENGKIEKIEGGRVKRSLNLLQNENGPCGRHHNVLRFAFNVLQKLWRRLFENTCRNSLREASIGSPEKPANEKKAKKRDKKANMKRAAKKKKRKEKKEEMETNNNTKRCTRL